MLRQFTEQPAVDKRKVGLIGHSEGAVVAAIVANADPRIAFAVLLAGPGVPLRELIAAQAQAILELQAVPESIRSERLDAIKKVNDAVVAATSTDERKAAVTKILTEAGAPPGEISAQVSLASAPWYVRLIAYDPAPALAKLTIPILAVNGEKDLQVLAKQNLPAIRAATKGNVDATIVELPGLNHLFQTSGTGDPREYGTIEETFSPAVLKLIADWINERT